MSWIHGTVEEKLLKCILTSKGKNIQCKEQLLNGKVEVFDDLMVLNGLSFQSLVVKTDNLICISFCILFCYTALLAHLEGLSQSSLC